MKSAGATAAETSRSSPSRLLELLKSPESGIQIWTAHLSLLRSNEIVELAALLDAAERSRAARFRFARDRQYYVAARGLLRQLLGTVLNRPASELIFEYGRNGKPAIAGTGSRGLHFNVSHSAGWAMFALAWDRELGIDLEAAGQLARKAQDLFDLAVRVLSPCELAIWRALPSDAARCNAFLRAWTRKEAYLKATGEGLRDRLERIEVALDAADPQRSLTLPCFPQGEEIPRYWTLYDLPSPLGFAAAVAIEDSRL